MGYDVEMDISGVVIPADKVADCLAAVNEMFTDENLSAHAGGGAGGPSITEETPVREKRWYSWVGNPDDDGFPSPLIAWRYYAEENEDQSVTLQYFEGSKLGDDEQLFAALAPFVKSGALIECRGEDGAHWRYVFENGEMKEQEAIVRWE